jgi:hypothetical protein
MEPTVVPDFSLSGQPKAQARCPNQERPYDADFSPQLPRNSNDIMPKNHANLGRKRSHHVIENKWLRVRLLVKRSHQVTENKTSY